MYRIYQVNTGTKSRRTGAADISANKIPMPAEKDLELYNMNHRRHGKAFIFNNMNFDPKLLLRAGNGTHNDRYQLTSTNLHWTFP
jgi:hypothetical protein